MSNAILPLPIRKKWFDMIKSGEKTEEYRDIKGYYETRFRNIGLLDEEGSPIPDAEAAIRFRNGYGTNAPFVDAICSIAISEGFPEWGAESEKEYYVLNIKELIEAEKESSPETNASDFNDLSKSSLRQGNSEPKSFILDTNILLSSGKSALYGFDDNIVYITGTTLQELDTKKSLPGELGYNAREVIRELDALRIKGDLSVGVSTGRGECRIEPDGVNQEYLPLGYSVDVADNRIIATCIYLTREYPNERFILVTNDISMRVNADQCFKYADAKIGIEGYRNDRVIEKESYHGFVTDENADTGLIDRLYREGSAPLGHYKSLNNLQFIILKNGQQSAIAVRLHDRLELIKDKSCFGIKKTYNAHQKMLLWALLAPVEDVPLVVVKGPAGTGKTLLAVAAGVDGVYDKLYNKVLLGRSNVENRQEQAFGFLPGTLEQKMDPLLSPFRDNLEVLLRKDTGSAESNDQIQMQITDMMQTIIEVCPLAYIRGRSISHSYLVLDEAQNTSKTVIRDLITRAGIKSKVVILGDPSQIDASTLDKWSCGLEIVWEKMRGVAAQIEFGEEESVRSELAKAAIKRIT